MSNIRSLAACVLPALCACGCASMTPTEQGVTGGGLLGAGTGALIGNAVGHTGAGALIGAGVGAVSGGLIGNSVEKSEQRTQAQIAAAEARAQVGIGDVIQMTHNHVNDGIIINQIRTSGTVFHLTGQDVLTLKQNGVSDAVVQEMQATACRAPRRYYSAAPVYGPVYAPGYVVAPPPVAVGVGFGYTGYGRRW
jgi:hypothetical protein